MERSTKKGAGRSIVVPRLVNEKQLSAFLSSKGGQSEFVQRLAETLRQAWCRIEELQQTPERDEQEAVDFARYERVLVVSETDGTVEIFSESWVSVKHLEVRPWEDRDEAVQALSDDWKALDAATKSRVLIVPQVRPKLDDAALLDLARWEKRSQVLATWLDAVSQLRTK